MGPSRFVAWKDNYQANTRFFTNRHSENLHGALWMEVNNGVPPARTGKFKLMSPSDPDPKCSICPRLAEFRDANISSQPDWFNGAVPGFGDKQAQLLIVGLAPGLKGANRTGRPFTGDYAGDLLYPTLIEHGFADGVYGADPADGLVLRNALITNAVRCVPPKNKPVAAEINNCRPFLLAQINKLEKLKVIIALGKVAHDSVVRSLGARLKDVPFGHNRAHRFENGLHLIDSYHCSRYNTNTRRLTEVMFHEVFLAASILLEERTG